eukprot:symbB.v1.2.009589.t1/scaffold608.1/size181862/6
MAGGSKPLRFQELLKEVKSLRGKLVSGTLPQQIQYELERPKGTIKTAKELGIVIASLGKISLWRYAVHLLHHQQEMKLQVDLIVYNVAIAACDLGGSWASAVQMAVELLSAMQLHGASYDVISFSSAINAAANANANVWIAAVEMLRWMLLEQVEPNIITHSSLLSALGDEWQRVLLHLTHIRSQAVLPNRITNNIVLRSFASSSNWKLAIEFLDTAIDEGLRPKSDTYAAILSVCESASCWARLLR